ncbi:MAG TPA: Calx-beta domain-containing protein [Pyrinomonadaceae bacterium]|nr:Calx-beta domain-containing protein [Pyrinomonadaceae bacterium]
MNSAGTATGNRSSGDSGDYRISADGRYIVFSSDASDIVPNDTNVWPDVFVRDMATGVTRLVSVTQTGVSGNHSSWGAIISGNGRYVLFNSFASDFILSDTNGTADVYVRDLQTDTTRLVSRDRTNTKSGFGYSLAHAITPDGRYVLFYSAATDLVSVPGTEPPGYSVFVRDLQTGTTRLVSINKEGTAWINRNANPVVITPDGRYVTFTSAATDITNDDPTDQNDVFVRDMQTDTTRLVSVATTGTSGDSSSEGGTMSDNGRYIFFTSRASNLTTTPDTNSDADYFVRDTQAGTTTLISVNKAGTASGRNTQNPNGFFSSLAVTPDGRHIAFTSQADDLVDNDQNGSNDDVFVRDLQTSMTRLVSVGLLGRSGNFGGRNPSISADGRYVAFESLATDLVNVPDFVGGLTSDVFVRDLQAGATVLGSINQGGTATPNDSAFAPRISADGRRVVYYSRASNIVANDVNGPDGKDVFTFDPVFPPTSHLQFSAATYTVGEGEEHATISVTRTDSSLGAVSVNYATSDGTARAGRDYIASSGTLTFAAGDTTPKTFNIPIINDTLSEANETINLSFTSPTGDAAVGTPAQAVLTITDNDPLPALHVSNVNVPEGGTGETINAIFRVTLSAASSTTITVTYGTADGTALAGSDYEAIAGSLTFNPGETSKTVSVNVSGDTSVETDETFTLKLMNPVGATTGAGGTGTITNDDPGTQFNVSGSVNDPSTGGVSGVTITLHLDQAGTTLTTQTDANGNYMFINLPLGQNRVIVTPLKTGLSFSPTSSGIVSTSSIGGNNTINFLSGTLYLANLTGAQVVPPNNSNGEGFGTLTLSLDEKKASVDLNPGTLSGFQRQAHIHSSTGPGANGPIQFTLPSGLVRNFLITLTPAQVQLLKAGQLYFDVHTDLFTGGEIRGQLLPLPPPAVQFSAASYSVEESAGQIILTVTRAGDTSGALSVDYQTSDTDTFTVGCSDTVNNRGGAYARCDFATAVGTVSFAPGETSKNITIPIIDDAIVEADENFHVRLTNAVGATLNTNSTIAVTIRDNDQAGQPNPVVSSFSFFVRQQYLDFLSREPDQNGFNAWLGLLNGCPDAFNGPSTPSGCDRIYVSGEGFFRSQEFQLKGFYVFRFYKVAFNRLPEYSEVVSDMSFVAGRTAEEVYARKAQLATLITQRQEFQTLYDEISNAQYVSVLMNRYNLQEVVTPDPASPDGSLKVTLTSTELTNRLNANTLTRAQVLRAVADSDAVSTAEFNHAFVGMQYYGYLRRKPDQDGFNAWLSVLQSGDVRTMVNGFLNSTEYKLRFGQP